MGLTKYRWCLRGAAAGVGDNGNDHVNQADAAAPEEHASESQDLACMCKHAYCVDENLGSHDTPLQACEP